MERSFAINFSSLGKELRYFELFSSLLALYLDYLANNSRLLDCVGTFPRGSWLVALSKKLWLFFEV